MEGKDAGNEELERSVAKAFVERRGAAVFSALAKTFSELSPSCAGILAWSDYRGGLRAVVDQTATVPIPSDRWVKIAVGLSEAPAVSALDDFPGIVAPWRAYVLPLRTRGEIIGLAGIAAPDAQSAVAPAERIASAVGLIQSLLAERLREIHAERPGQTDETPIAAGERRFRDFLQTAPDVMYVSDAKGILSLVSRSATDLLGLPADKILGKPLSSFCPFPETHDLLLAKITSEGRVEDFEISFKKPDGTIIIAAESASAVYGEDGGVSEIYGVIRDISQRLNGQRDIWKANIELTRTNEDLVRAQGETVRREKLVSIGRLAATIAGGIDGPLGRAISRREALKRGCAARAGDSTASMADLSKLIDEMGDDLAKLEALVCDLNSFTRPKANEEKLPYDLNEGAKKAFAIAGNEIKRVADVSFDLGAPTPPRAYASEIDRAILNILMNAAQAIGSSPSRERGRIAIRTGTAESGSWMEIEDNGPGIPDSARERLFEPFFTTKAPGKEKGLGLSIAWDIVVHRHAGTLSHNPGRRGRGAIFRIELPSRMEKEAHADK